MVDGVVASPHVLWAKSALPLHRLLPAGALHLLPAFYEAVLSPVYWT